MSSNSRSDQIDVFIYILSVIVAAVIGFGIRALVR